MVSIGETQLLSKTYKEEKAAAAVGQVETGLLTSALDTRAAKRIGMRNYHPQIVVPFVASFVVYAVLTVISYTYDPTFSVFDTARMLGAALFATLWFVIGSIQRSIIIPTIKLVYLNCATEACVAAVDDWTLRFLSIKRQVATCLLVSVFGMLSLWIVNQSRPESFHIASYAICFLCAFNLGLVAYCIVFLPTLTKVLSTQEMQMFWLTPAETPFLRKFCSIQYKLSLAACAAVSLYSVGLSYLPYLKNSQIIEVRVALYLAILWFAAGLGIIAFSLFYPPYYIELTIRAEKSRQMEKIQQALRSFQDRFELSEEDRQHVAYMLELNRKLIEAKESATKFPWFIRGLIPLSTSLAPGIKNLLSAIYKLYL